MFVAVPRTLSKDNGKSGQGSETGIAKISRGDDALDKAVQEVLSSLQD